MTRTGDSVTQSRLSRARWTAILLAIVTAGILSRSLQSGHSVFDKYLGDALYAAMVYVLFRLTGRFRRVALWSAATMIAIEFFQLTGIPAALYRSEYLPIRLIARLMGTQFHWLDLVAYAAGILPFAVFTRLRRPP